MTVATLFTLVSFVSAAEEAEVPYLYAYYSTVEVDGVLDANGADGTVGNMGADTEYDNDVANAEHAIEYVLDGNVGEAKLAAAWNLEAKELYLALVGNFIDLEIEIGGETITVDVADETADGVDGVEVAVEGETVELSIPLDKTLELTFDGKYVVVDTKITTDAASFEGKIAFTGNVPIVVFNADQSYRAKTIAREDMVLVKGSNSGAGRIYRHWLGDSTVEDGVVTVGTNLWADNNPRSGYLLYGYDPMYGDITVAENYLLKADVTINGLPEVDKATIAGSRDIGMNGLAYDKSKDHVSVYLANNTNNIGAVMNCCSIFNTDEGLKMVINSILGDGQVIDLGKEEGDTFELKIINNVVAYDKEADELEDEDYVLDVYVDDVLVGTAVNYNVKGTSISEWGFGFNTIKSAADSWSGSLVVENLVSAYEIDVDEAALMALSDGSETLPPETSKETESETESDTESTPVGGSDSETESDTESDTESADVPSETTTKPADTTKPAATTTKPATTTDAGTEDGCGSSLVGYGAIMVIGSAVMAVVATSKKKED